MLHKKGMPISFSLQLSWGFIFCRKVKNQAKDVLQEKLNDIVLGNRLGKHNTYVSDLVTI